VARARGEKDLITQSGASSRDLFFSIILLRHGSDTRATERSGTHCAGAAGSDFDLDFRDRLARIGPVLVVIEFPVESRCQFVADFQSRADQGHLGLDEAAVLLVRKRTLVDNTRDRKGAQRVGLEFAVFRPGRSARGCFGIHDMPDLE